MVTLAAGVLWQVISVCCARQWKAVGLHCRLSSATPRPVCSTWCADNTADFPVQLQGLSVPRDVPTTLQTFQCNSKACLFHVMCRQTEATSPHRLVLLWRFSWFWRRTQNCRLTYLLIRSYHSHRHHHHQNPSPSRQLTWTDAYNSLRASCNLRSTGISYQTDNKTKWTGMWG